MTGSRRPLSRKAWAARASWACRIMDPSVSPFRQSSDGREVSSADGASVETTNSATSATLAEVAFGRSADVERRLRDGSRSTWTPRWFVTGDEAGVGVEVDPFPVTRSFVIFQRPTSPLKVACKGRFASMQRSPRDVPVARSVCTFDRSTAVAASVGVRRRGYQRHDASRGLSQPRWRRSARDHVVSYARRVQFRPTRERAHIEDCGRCRIRRVPARPALVLAPREHAVGNSLGDASSGG